MLNLKTDIWDQFRFHLGVALHFDVEFKYPIDDYHNDTYEISAVIRDQSGNIIFNDPEITAKIYATKEKKEGNRYVDTHVYLFVPRNKLGLMPGKCQFMLELNARNEEVKFPAIYNDSISVTMPEFYEYGEQEFGISNFIVKKEKKNDQEGIKTEMDCAYQFMSQQVIDFEENENARHYYFYLTITDEYGNIVFLPADYSEGKEQIDYIRQLAKPKGEKDHMGFFISYRRLNLPPGPHNLKVALQASDEKRNVLFRNLAVGEISIIQTEIYLADIAVSGLTVKYGQYDVSNVFGRMFSKKNKNKGKGYPDLIWHINTGYDKIYTSGISKNTFTAYDGSVFFRMADTDPVEIVVEDQDNLVNNDWIASYRIENKNGPLEIMHRDLASGEIEKMDIRFSKKTIPVITTKSLTAKQSKREGVSGYDVFINSEITGMTGDMKIRVIPGYIDDNQRKKMVEHYRIITGEQLQDNRIIEIAHDSKQENTSLFIPCYALPAKASLGYDTDLSGYNMSIGTYYAKPLGFCDTVKDITFSPGKIQEGKINGFYGLDIRIDYKIPSMYLDDIGLNNISILCNVTDKLTHQPFSELKDIKGLSDQESIFSLNFFLPFYRLIEYGERIELLFNLSADIAGKIIAGKESETIVINRPDLINLKFATAEIKYKDADKTMGIRNVSLDVMHGDRNIYISEQQPVGKKITLKFFNQVTEYVHPEDDITFRLMGTTEYETMHELESWTLKASELLPENRKQIKGKFAKRLKLTD
ncbi:MAG: hypothetical protein ABIJ16_00665 [Bacteroidota bacterium]